MATKDTPMKIDFLKKIYLMQKTPLEIALAMTPIALALALALEWLFTKTVTITTAMITIPATFGLTYFLSKILLRYQNELNEQRAQLEAATRDLSYANGRMSAKNEELNAFAHTVAHELKTPLGVIMGYSHLLSLPTYEQTPENIADISKKITQTSLKMDSIIQEMLLFAKLRQNDPIDTMPLDMDAIVNEALARLDTMIIENQARIKKPATWYKATGYAPWIEEVWSNYINNAIKYGGSAPEIELGAEQQENGQIRFWVRDHGPGMSAEEQELVFNPFIRFNETQIAGHGLGLSISQRIIEKLGGEVGVESAPQNGSTFYFTLPQASYK